MRWVVVMILAGALLVGNESAALAKVSCKKIKEAIASGKTPDQVATELGTRVKRVENCASGKKGRKAEGAVGASGATGAPSAGADDEDEED